MKTEIPRLLKQGGTFIKIFMNWDTEDPIARASVALVKELNPAWDSDAAALRDLTQDLFPGTRTEVTLHSLPFTREGWHGRMCACRGTLASMDPITFEQWQKQHLILLSGFPDTFCVRHTLYLSVCTIA